MMADDGSPDPPGLPRTVPILAGLGGYLVGFIAGMAGITLFLVDVMGWSDQDCGGGGDTVCDALGVGFVLGLFAVGPLIGLAVFSWARRKLYRRRGIEVPPRRRWSWKDPYD